MSTQAVSGHQTCYSPATSSICISRNITHIKPIWIDLSKAQVEYPLSPRKLTDLRNGPKLNIYVGESPALDQVFNGFPSSVLAHFCPALRKSLHSMKWSENYIVVLPGLCKSAVGWFLRFSLAGGQFVHRKSESKDSTEFIHRLHAMLALGFDGQMTRLFWKRLITEVQSATVKWDQIEWLYLDNANGIMTHYSSVLVREIAYGIMHGKMAAHKHLQGCRSNQAFYDSMRDIVLTLNGIIARRQVRERTPLSICQVEFIFAFTRPGEKTREVLCHGLARLMVDGMVNKGTDYIEFSRHNEDFLKTVALFGEEYQEHKKLSLKYRASARKQNRKDVTSHKRTSTRGSSGNSTSESGKNQTEVRSSKHKTEVDILPPEPHNLTVFPALPVVAQLNHPMEASCVPRVSLPLEARKAEKHDKEVENSQKVTEDDERNAELSKGFIHKSYQPIMYRNRGNVLGNQEPMGSPTMFTLAEATSSCTEILERPDILRYEACAPDSRSKAPLHLVPSQQLNGDQQLNSIGIVTDQSRIKENLAVDGSVQDSTKPKPIPRVNLPKADQYSRKSAKDIVPTQQTLAQASAAGIYGSIYAGPHTRQKAKACRHTEQNPFPRPNIPSATALEPPQLAPSSKKSSSRTSSGEGGGIPVSSTMVKAHNSDSIQRITNWLERTKLSPSNSNKSAQSSDDSSGGGVNLQKRHPNGSRRVRGKRGGRYKRVWNRETKLWDKVLKGPEDYEIQQSVISRGGKKSNRRIDGDRSKTKCPIGSTTSIGDATDHEGTPTKDEVQICEVQLASNTMHMPITWD